MYYIYSYTTAASPNGECQVNRLQQPVTNIPCIYLLHCYITPRLLAEDPLVEIRRLTYNLYDEWSSSHLTRHACMIYQIFGDDYVFLILHIKY